MGCSERHRTSVRPDLGPALEELLGLEGALKDRLCFPQRLNLVSAGLLPVFVRGVPAHTCRLKVLEVLDDSLELRYHMLELPLPGLQLVKKPRPLVRLHLCTLFLLSLVHFARRHVLIISLLILLL